MTHLIGYITWWDRSVKYRVFGSVISLQQVNHFLLFTWEYLFLLSPNVSSIGLQFPSLTAFPLFLSFTFFLWGHINSMSCSYLNTWIDSPFALMFWAQFEFEYCCTTECAFFKEFCCSDTQTQHVLIINTKGLYKWLTWAHFWDFFLNYIPAYWVGTNGKLVAPRRVSETCVYFIFQVIAMCQVLPLLFFYWH